MRKSEEWDAFLRKVSLQVKGSEVKGRLLVVRTVL